MTGAYRSNVEAWWNARDERLRDPDSWLTLVGLHWLAPRDNRLGADPANEIVLDSQHLPPVAGTLRLAGGSVRLLPASDALRLDDGPAVEGALADDIGSAPSVLALGSLRMHLIRRGERIGLRVRDHAAPALRAFAGMNRFALDPTWRLAARFERAAADERLEIVDVTGATGSERTPGRVTFEREGATWTIDTLAGGEDGSLWLIFGDATNGRETYGGGRFLYSEPHTDGEVVVDFNLAYNPPCVFSPFATCPLPPPQNRLSLRIEAGERSFKPARRRRGRAGRTPGR